MKAKKVSLLGILGAVALVLSFLEGVLIPQMPFLPVGAKPGLSNVITMLTAKVMGAPYALYITAIKVLFAFVTRGATAAFMSLCGGLLSTLAVCILLRYEGKIFSFLGIGIVGALAHNLGQLFGASVLSGTVAIFSYGKYLLIFSLLTGFVTGSMLLVLMPRLEKISRDIYK